MPMDRTQPTPEEKYGPVVRRYLADAEQTDEQRGLDVAIEHLCLELSIDEGPLEQQRLYQELGDEWAAIRSLLPERDSTPPAFEDRYAVQRMEEINRHRMAIRRAANAANYSADVGMKVHLLGRLLDAKAAQQPTRRNRD